MKMKPIDLSQFFFAGALGLALGLSSGCQSLAAKRPPPVTVREIIELSKANMPSYDIIQKIHDSGTVYKMKASELAKLKEQGVPDNVIDYMQETYLEAMRSQQYYYSQGWNCGPDGYWYGGYPFGWPYQEVIVVGHEHHEHHRHGTW